MFIILIIAVLDLGLPSYHPTHLLGIELARAQATSSHILPQRQDVPLSPRTQIGRKNLRYEFDLHPANVFRHLEAVEKHERSFKLKRRIKMFRDRTIFDDDV